MVTIIQQKLILYKIPPYTLYDFVQETVYIKSNSVTTGTVRLTVINEYTFIV